MKLPEELYVAVAGEGEDQYLQANGEIANCIEDDGPTEIGIYKLENTVVVTKEIAIKTKP